MPEGFSFFFFFVDPKTGHYPGAVNIPFPKLFDPDTKSLKKLDDLKKGMMILKNITSAYRFNLLTTITSFTCFFFKFYFKLLE